MIYAEGYHSSPHVARNQFVWLLLRNSLACAATLIIETGIGNKAPSSFHSRLFDDRSPGTQTSWWRHAFVSPLYRENGIVSSAQAKRRRNE